MHPIAAISFLLLAFALFSSAEIARRDGATSIPTTASSAYNYGPLPSILASLISSLSTATVASIATPTVAPKTANLSNIAAPPANFIPIIMTAVPLTVLGDILDTESRSSLASEFRNGTTPAWYQNLPGSIQSYLTLVNDQIKAGALSASTSAAVTSSSSSAMAPTAGPPVPTGFLPVNVLGALGVAGLAMVL